MNKKIILKKNQESPKKIAPKPKKTSAVSKPDHATSVHSSKEKIALKTSKKSISTVPKSVAASPKVNKISEKTKKTASKILPLTPQTKMASKKLSIAPKNNTLKVSSDAAPKGKFSAPSSKNEILLTEQQLLAMSTTEYMNESQLTFFKNKLRQLEQDLLKNAGETSEHLRETTLVPDPADRATIEEEHAIELRTRDRERKLLKKIQQSIHSIDAGTYGWCEETGEPIGIPRLLARPTATLSLEAQQRRELKQKLYGD